MFDIDPIISPHSTDCGATCLQMLLAYYGQDVPLEQLREEVNTRLIGCTGKDLIRAGRLHGLDLKAYEYKTDRGDVADEDRPSICHWQHRHWVVCCGTDEDGKVVICNPDKGRYRMSKAQFAAWFSGVAIVNGALPEQTETVD